MPILKKEVRNGITHIFNKYEPEEMPEYWMKNDRYIKDAKSMNEGCVVVECTKKQAKEISAYFATNLYAMPTCTYYDGKKLSLSCDYAGRNTNSLIESTKKYISKYLGKS